MHADIQACFYFSKTARLTGCLPSRDNLSGVSRDPKPLGQPSFPYRTPTRTKVSVAKKSCHLLRSNILETLVGM